MARPAGDRPIDPLPMTVAGVSFAAIDFESAGMRRGGTDVPVQIGIASMRGGVIGDFFLRFIGTEQPITWSAQKVHGIRAEDLRGAPDLPALWPSIKKRLEAKWIVAHSASTEKRFLRAFPFHGFGPWIDTLRLARAVWPQWESFSLGDLVAAAGLEPEWRALGELFRWHDALADAVASLVLLRRIIAECGIEQEDAGILLRPDDSAYHRRRGRRE